jgi:hypothetical protein
MLDLEQDGTMWLVLGLTGDGIPDQVSADLHSLGPHSRTR